MQKTFKCEIEWDTEYVPYITSWKLTDCSLNESISGNAIIDAINKWLTVKQDIDIETYSFQAVCDTFNEEYQSKLFSVDIGENMIVHWTIVAEPYVIRVTDGDEWYGVQFIANEVN